MPKRTNWGVLILASFVVAGCSDDDPTGMGDNSDPIARVTASPNSVRAGDNFQTIVTIDASASSDADGDALTFSWVVPNGRFENGTTNQDQIIEVSFPGSRPYAVVVTVSDGQGGEDEATISIGIL